MTTDATVTPARYVIGGRRWVASYANGPFRQPLYVDRLLHDAGFAAAYDRLGDPDDADAEVRAEEAIWYLLGPEVTPELLAGLVVEEGARWTLDTAQRHAVWFGELTDTTDHALMRGAVLHLLPLYLGLGGQTSSATSPSSTPVAPPTISAATPRETVADPSTAGAATSDALTTSSAS